MRGPSGVLCVAVAALLVCCSADPHQDPEVNDAAGERFDYNEIKKEEYGNFLRALLQYQNLHNRNLIGIGGSGMIGRALNGGIGGSTLLGRNSELQTRSAHGIGGSTLIGKSLTNIGGSSMLGRNLYDGPNMMASKLEGGKRYARFVDSLGGGNFVRNLDSIGGGNFVRNLDSIGGGNFVRELDSIGGGNLV